jgi:hypothetical protein
MFMIFMKNFEDVIEEIKNNEDCVLIHDDNSIFNALFIQPLYRTIEDHPIQFVGIRNLKLKEEFKSKYLFTHFFEQLEQLNKNVMFQDVINDRLMKFLESNGYKILHEVKSYSNIISFYKLKI